MVVRGRAIRRPPRSAQADTDESSALSAEGRSLLGHGEGSSMARLSTPRLTALGICAALFTGTLMVLVPSNTAWADPSADAWHQLRVCESGDNYSINTGNAHYGAYQFDLATWRSVGGSGYPYQASAGEQDARALVLYRMRGWQPWQCATILGLHEIGRASCRERV